MQQNCPLFCRKGALEAQGLSWVFATQERKKERKERKKEHSKRTLQYRKRAVQHGKRALYCVTKAFLCSRGAL